MEPDYYPPLAHNNSPFDEKDQKGHANQKSTDNLHSISIQADPSQILLHGSGIMGRISGFGGGELGERGNAGADGGAKGEDVPIDLDSEPCHSELHPDNKKLAHQ